MKTGDRIDLRIFQAQKLLCEFAREFYHDAMGPAFWVPKQGDDDVTVTEVEKCLRSVSRESSQLVEESNLYTVPTMRVPLLRSRQIGLQDSNEILNIHRCFLPLLVTQSMFLG
jgi:hypothetical protein